jgi:Ca2+-binding EF-hand superfamily protein
MSTLSAVSRSSSAWAQMNGNRSQIQAKMLAKVDAESSGGVHQTELQGLLDDVASKTSVSSSTKTSELFSKMDGNNDGSLTSDELAKGIASILPPPSTMSFAQSRSSQGSDSSGAEKFAKLDADGSGTLSKDEMLNLLTQKASQGPGPGWTTSASTDEMFAHFDSDGDGSLTQAEFDAGAPPTQAQAVSGTQGADGPPGAG